MPAPRTVGPEQLELLLQFMEEHRDFAMGQDFYSTPVGKQEACKMWADLANKLNSMNVGAFKPVGRWREYWNEQKYSARKKFCILRKHGSNVADRTFKKFKVYDQDKRIFAIMGKDIMYHKNFSQRMLNLQGSKMLDKKIDASYEESSRHHSISLPVEVKLELLNPEDEDAVMNQGSSGDSGLDSYIADEPAIRYDSSRNGNSTIDERENHWKVKKDISMNSCTSASAPDWVRQMEERRLALEERRLAIDEKFQNQMLSILGNIVGELRQVRKVLEDKT